MRDFRKRLVPILIAAVAFAAGSPGDAPACQICIPFPKKSAADYLIEADVIVLAREDPGRPFHFAPVEMLKGDPGDEAIDLFLDSATRRILAAHPERKILLARLNDGKSKSWRRIGTADEEFGPIVYAILKRSAGWEQNPEERIAFFAELLAHENAQIRTLAHLEIARAPYDASRNCSGAISREEIHSFLKNVRYIEWHPLYILLLAQSDVPSDHALIADSFESAARFNSTMRLAAWATALIEIQDEAAVDEIEDRYFRNATRKPEELKAILQALSVHGTNGHTHLRDRIVSAYGTLLEHHPSMAPTIVGDLTAWKRRDLAKPMAAIVADPPSGLDFQALLKLRVYLRKSDERGAIIPATSTRSLR